MWEFLRCYKKIFFVYFTNSPVESHWLGQTASHLSVEVVHLQAALVGNLLWSEAV